jgi:DNA-binding Xre family transcriptional regulator
VLRLVVARNVQLLMDTKYESEPIATNRLHKLSKDADVSVSTLGRLFEGEVGITLDTLERLALALGCSPTDLLIPPPEVRKVLGFAPIP